MNGASEQYVLTREDKLSLAFHERISEKLRIHPEGAIAKAKANAKKLARIHPHMAPHMAEWERWLALPIPELRSLITDATEKSVWMRHVSVFAGVLSPEGRNDAIRSQRGNQ